MDGDGDIDLLTGTRWGYVAYYERLSNGSLAAPDTIFDMEAFDNSQPLVWDWDNDGDLDLLVTGHSSKDYPIFLFENKGDLKTSVDPLNYDIVSAPQMGEKDKYQTIAKSDLDGDGLEDLIFAISCYDINKKNAYIKIRWYKNQGTKSSPYFSNYEYLSFDGVDSVDDVSETYKVPYITATDYNGDNIPDIMIGASQQKLAVPEEQLVVWYGKRLNTSLNTNNYINNSYEIVINNNLISLHGNFSDAYSFKLIDMKGRVFVNTLNVTSKVSLPQKLPNGIYLINIEVDGQRFQKKFVNN